MQPRVLVVGADSTIGRALTARMSAGDWSVTGTSRRIPLSDGVHFLDLSRAVIDSALPNEDFAVAIFCAGFTGQQACSDNRVSSRQINVEGTVALARLLSRRGTFVIHLSTNLVFDGRAPFPREDSPVSPQNEYGHQKADAERQILALSCPGAVIRLTKVFHRELPLLSKWRSALQRGERVRAFVDAPVSPLLLDDVVRGLCIVAETRTAGLWHFSGPTDFSYFDVASSLAAIVGATAASVEPVVSVMQETQLGSPAFSALGMQRTRLHLGLTFPGLDHVLNELNTARFSECVQGSG